MVLSKIEQLVKHILEKHPETRGDDWNLVLKVWEAQGLKTPLNDLNTLRRYVHPESITRVGRDIKKRYDWLRPKNYQSKLFNQQRVRNYYAN